MRNYKKMIAEIYNDLPKQFTKDDLVEQFAKKYPEKAERFKTFIHIQGINVLMPGIKRIRRGNRLQISLYEKQT
jgi:hypothetical protein